MCPGDRIRRKVRHRGKPTTALENRPPAGPAKAPAAQEMVDESGRPLRAFAGNDPCKVSPSPSRAPTREPYA